MADTDLGHYKPLFENLASAHVRFAVIGGHAAGLWAKHYGVIKTIITSKDLDLRGQSEVAFLIRDLIDGKLQEWKSKGTKEPYFWAIRHAKNPAIEVTTEIPLVEDEKVYAFKLKVPDFNFSVPVSDPLTLLCSKIETASRTLTANRKGERKDFVHLRYLSQCVEPFLKELTRKHWKTPTPTEAKEALLRRLEKRTEKLSAAAEIAKPVRFMLNQCFLVSDLPPKLRKWAKQVEPESFTSLLETHKKNIMAPDGPGGGRQR